MQVAHGYRRPLPKSLGPETQALISECWAQEPHNRPSMTQVLERLQDIEASGGPGSGDKGGSRKGSGMPAGAAGDGKQHTKGCCSCTIA